MNRNDSRPFISVIITVYNDEKYLRKCIDSVLNQSYDLLEILLVDDGSTDKSAEMCDEYELSNEKVRAIHKTNGGTVSAREYGLQHAKGEMVSFVDGDDWIDSDMYERLVEMYLQENCPDIISSGIIHEYPNAEKTVKMDDAVSGRYDKSDIESRLLPVLVYDFSNNGHTVLTSVCTKLVRREIAVMGMRFMDHSLTLGEDGAYVYFIMMCCDSVLIVHDAFYHYEHHEGSQNHKYDLSSFEKIVRLKQVMSKGMDELGWGSDRRIQRQVGYHVYGYLYRVSEAQLDIELNPRTYLFPFAVCERGSVILLYGAGKVGKSYEKCLRLSSYAEKIIWVDKNYKELQKMGMDVVSIEDALSQDYDYAVIAIEKESIAMKIVDDLMKHGVKSEKIIWRNPISISEHE